MFLVNVLVNRLADSIFSQSIKPAFFKFHTWFFQGLCFHVMPCSFQLVPNFLVKNAFFGDRYFLYLFYHKFLCIFHNSNSIQGISIDLYRNVDPDDQARCTQVALLYFAYFPSYFPLHFFFKNCVCSITSKLFKIFG